jgi:ribosome-associated heat shock protein Hsp15
MNERERVDKWLWAVRVFKTRTAATDACAAGRVTVDGEVVKPAARIGVGQEVRVRRGDRLVVLGVREVIAKRVGAPRAAECVEDRSPPVPAADGPDLPVVVRERGAGRPTKRDRRRTDALRRSGSR